MLNTTRKNLQMYYEELKNQLVERQGKEKLILQREIKILKQQRDSKFNN